MTRLIVLTDSNYIEPAFVTILSIAAQFIQNVFVTLIYLAGNEDDANSNEESFRLIQRFEKLLKIEYPELNFSSIILHSSYFLEFERYHFNRSNLQKLTFPEIFREEKTCISIDAGMILGKELKVLLEEISSDEQFTVKAFTKCSDECMPKNQKRFKRNKYYPAGGILAFNNNNYMKANILNRLVSGFEIFRSDLIYPEQDLMCLTLIDNELKAFNHKFKYFNIDMTDQENWSKFRINEYKNLYIEKDFLYMKHIGSFKPWHKWVLNPIKSIYLNEISKSIDKFGVIFNDKLLQDKHQYFNEKLIHYLNPQLDLLKKYCLTIE